MPRKSKAEVEYEVSDPHKERVLRQEVTYLAKPGRNITDKKIDVLERTQRNVVGLVGEAMGIELLDVKSSRE